MSFVLDPLISVWNKRSQFDSKVDNASSSDDEDIDESLSVPKRPETEVCEPLVSLIGIAIQ